MKFELKRLEPVIITIQGKDYPAKLTHRAIIELEELTGMGHIEFLSKLEGATTNIKDIQLLLYVSLKGGGVDVTLDDLLDHDFTISDNTKLLTALAEVIDRAIGIDDETDQAPKKKQKE